MEGKIDNKSTAIYPNRLKDKKELEEKLMLFEFGSEDLSVMMKDGEVLARGYRRVVYGDHGPYLELDKDQFQIPLLSRFGNNVSLLPEENISKYYYFWLYPKGYPECKIYWQIKPVKDLPSAPPRPDKKRSRYNRQEGYADYKRGLYYINPYLFQYKQYKEGQYI